MGSGLAGGKAREEISRSKSAFVSKVSHELRTPLNAIIGYSELLIETAQDRGDQAAATDNQRVLDAAAGLLSMVNELLRLSAIDAGELKVNIDECDVNALVRDVALAIAAEAGANGNRIVVELHPERGFWLCDGSKLDHCLRNLVSNAAKFTRDGVITVRAKHETIEGRSWLRLEVADTGIGIEPALLDKLFVPFGLADASVTRSHEGVGLGLAITRRLAQLMGGGITVASAPNRGSCFTLRVPAEFSPDAVAETRAIARTA